MAKHVDLKFGVFEYRAKCVDLEFGVLEYTAKHVDLEVGVSEYIAIYVDVEFGVGPPGPVSHTEYCDGTPRPGREARFHIRNIAAAPPAQAARPVSVFGILLGHLLAQASRLGFAFGTLWGHSPAKPSGPVS